MVLRIRNTTTKCASRAAICTQASISHAPCPSSLRRAMLEAGRSRVPELLGIVRLGGRHRREDAPFRSGPTRNSSNLRTYKQAK